MARVQYLNPSPDYVDMKVTGLHFPRQFYIAEDVDDVQAEQLASRYPEVFRIVADGYVEQAPEKSDVADDVVEVDNSLRIPDGEGGDVGVAEATKAQMVAYVSEKWPHINISSKSDVDTDGMRQLIVRYTAAVEASAEQAQKDEDAK